MTLAGGRRSPQAGVYVNIRRNGSTDLLAVRFVMLTGDNNSTRQEKGSGFLWREAGEQVVSQGFHVGWEVGRSCFFMV